MSKLLMTLVLTLATVLSAQASNCSMKLSLGGGMYTQADEKSVLLKMEKDLAKKGYSVSSSDDAEYKLRVRYGNAMTLTDCYIFAAYVEIQNSGKQILSDATAETSFLREILNRGSIPKAMTLKAFKRALRKLPTCIPEAE